MPLVTQYCVRCDDPHQVRRSGWAESVYDSANEAEESALQQNWYKDQKTNKWICPSCLKYDKNGIFLTPEEKDALLARL